MRRWGIDGELDTLSSALSGSNSVRIGRRMRDLWSGDSTCLMGEQLYQSWLYSERRRALEMSASSVSREVVGSGRRWATSSCYRFLRPLHSLWYPLRVPCPNRSPNAIAISQTSVIVGGPKASFSGAHGSQR